MMLSNEMAGAGSSAVAAAAPAVRKPKLHGRAFYESIGSPKYIIAPMVNQSEFAWRMLSRSFMPESERSSLLAYSPMFHAKLFGDHPKYRAQQFQPTKPGSDAPFLDGNPAIDRPLFVQFCANDPQLLLNAARHAAPYCDAVDLNLGCPQGIAKAGRYGAFLQEDQELIYRLINTLHEHLDIPVTAKIRILDTKEATLEYARNVLRAGASILTVHGRRREQKGHLTGLADWQMIRYLRDNLPPETVLFANGNILQHGDLERCLAATGADGVMSAEGNLSNPAIFAPPPPADRHVRGYWRGRDGRGGWRVDEVFRRYLDILHRYVFGTAPPVRRPLFEPGDDEAWIKEEEEKEKEKKAIALAAAAQEGGNKGKKRKGEPAAAAAPSANLGAMQPHLFHLLRHFVARHHDVRDALARARTGDMEAYEAICAMVERRVAEGLLEYERTGGRSVEADAPAAPAAAGQEEEEDEDDPESSARAVRECSRPWWVVQPIIRPLPKEALAKGAVQLSKKERKRMAAEMEAGRAGMEDGDAKRSRDGAEDDHKPAAVAAELEKTTSYPSSELVSG